LDAEKIFTTGHREGRGKNEVGAGRSRIILDLRYAIYEATGPPCVNRISQIVN